MRAQTREIRVALVALGGCDVTQGCRTGRGRRGDMVRRRSPAKGHRTGHYATIAPFGSNGNFCQRASGWQK